MFSKQYLERSLVSFPMQLSFRLKVVSAACAANVSLVNFHSLNIEQFIPLRYEFKLALKTTIV